MQLSGMSRLEGEIRAIHDLEGKNEALRRSVAARRAAALSPSSVAAGSSTSAAAGLTGALRTSSDPWQRATLQSGTVVAIDRSRFASADIAAHDQRPMHTPEVVHDRHQPHTPEVPLPPGTRTLMVRNIPTRFTQNELMRLWPADGTYDLLYMPWSSKQRRFSGSAYINFGTEEDALRFRSIWHGRTLESHGRSEELKIVASYGQGLEGCLLGLKRDFPEGMTANHLPGIFELGTGNRLDFRVVYAEVLAFNAPGEADQSAIGRHPCR